MILGVDPGFDGAIAIFDPIAGDVDCHDMPTFPVRSGRREINHHGVLAVMALAPRGSTVWLEQVAARPGQGVASGFRFGQGYGALEMAIAACGHSIRYVTPQKWKRHFGLPADKDAARSVATQRFPDAAKLFLRKKDAGRAEACLIALYGFVVGHVPMPRPRPTSPEVAP